MYSYVLAIVQGYCYFFKLKHSTPILTQDYVKLDIGPFENGAITIQNHVTICYIFDNQRSRNYYYGSVGFEVVSISSLVNS